MAPPDADDTAVDLVVNACAAIKLLTGDLHTHPARTVSTDTTAAAVDEAAAKDARALALFEAAKAAEEAQLLSRIDAFGLLPSFIALG
jgi:hypothetical protein